MTHLRVILDIETGLYLHQPHKDGRLAWGSLAYARTFASTESALLLWRTHKLLKRHNIDTPLVGAESSSSLRRVMS